MQQGLRSWLLSCAILWLNVFAALAQDKTPTDTSKSETPAAETTPAETTPADTPKSETPAAAEEEVKQLMVETGIYVNQIHAVNLRENLYTIDFWLWFRWDGQDDYSPLESFEVINGRIESKASEYKDKIDENGKERNYAYCRVVATITQFWDISRFPLDDHILNLSVEDSDNEEFKVKFVADTENSRTGPNVRVPGWTVGPAKGIVSSTHYTSNYGDTSLPSDNDSTYSRFTWQITIYREGFGYFGKLFCGLFIATGISFLVFFIRPTDVDPRFGLGIGAIFASVASEYVITSVLPDTNLVTMADWLHILAFIFIFITLVESVYSLTLYCTEEPELVAKSKKLDWYSFWILLVFYLGLSATAIIFS